MNLLILGPPGSGKGTQSRELMNFLANASIIDCGMLLRSTDLNERDKVRMQNGSLLDDDFVASVVRKKIVQVYSCGKSFILDGFPRSLAQCVRLFDILKSTGASLDFAIKFQLSKDEILKRLLSRKICATCGMLVNSDSNSCANCGSSDTKRRSDDSCVQSIAKRIDDYYSNEASVLKYLVQKKINVINIDASGKPDSVTRDLKNQLLLFS